MTKNAILAFKYVSKTYTENSSSLTVLKQIDCYFNQGESVALMGASGSGKSTLLHLAAGLDHPTQGLVCFQGQSYADMPDKQLSLIRRKHLGFVFQQFNLIPGISVEDNILFQSRLEKTPPDAQWLRYLLHELELTPLLSQIPETLSGGQQQRVAIARALAHKPEMVMADEPTGNLHDSLSHQVMRLFVQLCHENNTGLLMVTHSKAMAGYLSKQLYLENGQLDVT